MLTTSTLLLITVCSLVSGSGLEDVFEWKQMSFQWPTIESREQAIASGAYVPSNNLPLGIERWNEKLFITIPRWKSGVASSLNYVNLNEAGGNRSPILHPYPSLESNTLPANVGDKVPEDSVISTFRIRVDPCDRLWVMDTGISDILGKFKKFSNPAIVIYDLKTDKLIKRYTLPKSVLKDDTFLANIAVDVTKDTCDNAYAYIPDLGGYGIVVYSLKDNDSWRIKHHFFHFDPLSGDYNVGGVNFQWTDGVFGLALSPIQKDGYRTMYFHALSSTREFKVSTEVLRNKTLSQDSKSYFLYKMVGDRGKNTQSSANFLDEKSGVLFYTQVNRDAIACWNTNKPFSLNNLGVVDTSNEKLIFPNDLKVDYEGYLWVLSDRMPQFIYGKLDDSMTNYRVLRAPVQKAVSNTPCAA